MAAITSEVMVAGIAGHGLIRQKAAITDLLAAFCRFLASVQDLGLGLRV